MKLFRTKKKPSVAVAAMMISAMFSALACLERLARKKAATKSGAKKTSWL